MVENLGGKWMENLVSQSVPRIYYTHFIYISLVYGIKT